MRFMSGRNPPPMISENTLGINEAAVNTAKTTPKSMR